MNLEDKIQKHFSESIQTKIEAADALSPAIAIAAKVLVKTLIQGGKILSCGNGSSAKEAHHFACQLINRHKVERPGLPAMALSSDGISLTAISNDTGFDSVFSRQIETLAESGDIILIISASGDSQNTVNAIKSAHSRSAKVIALTGHDGGKIAPKLSGTDTEIRVPSSDKVRINECHNLIIHILCDLIDQQLFNHS